MRLTRVHSAAATAALVLATTFAAPRAQAQLGYGADKGLKVKVKALNGDWLGEAGDGSDHTIAGVIGSDTPIEAFSVTHSRTHIEIDAMSNGHWTGWQKPGQPAGIPGSKMEAVRMRVDLGSIRYRVAFAGIGLSEWAEDGAIAGRPYQGLAIEAIEVQFLYDAKATDRFEYRAYFRGSGPTPWLKPGESAQPTKGVPELMAIEFRAGKGIKSEVAMTALGWLPTVLEGEVAGRPNGKGRVEALRLFGGVSPVQYRVKLEGRGWTAWSFDGEECGALGQSLRIEGIQVDVKRTSNKPTGPPRT